MTLLALLSACAPIGGTATLALDSSDSGMSP